ncbi:MAG TPA: styrene monooxygenase/indole monooxygenase family protein [Pseudonocardiaceae bacterium]|jgi:2-polyprenyl-6-methoxyphenol hydroxylase-like FAD-dependent oxidoreductase|nr:styrene monooxygenase/indole monooxygenase family protein [Pseudonocardiaceae bacterium]
MWKVLIVGAGQAGLQLGLSLHRHEYDVTIMSARTPDEIRSGRVMSTQCMFGPALQHERDYGLNLWERQTPKIEGLGLSIADPDHGRALDWVGRLDDYAQSVDQRVKMAGWLELFEDRGGKVVYHGVTTSDVDSLTSFYDLVIIAAGKGELVELFDRDPSRSPYTSTQRILSVVYVHGMTPRPEHPTMHAVRFNVIPGVGELFIMPCCTVSGPCDILFFEGIPGGPLDCWDDRPGPAEHLRRTLELMREYVPWEYERCASVELTDSRATLTGGYPPVVRQPVGELPSGGQVLGMADVVVANDPITGQGSNSASKCAASYLASILEQGNEPFDGTWMQRAFDRYWSDAQHTTMWTNALLGPPPEHVMKILGAASAYPEIARRFVNGFADPADYQHWFMDPDKAQMYLAAVASRQDGA